MAVWAWLGNHEIFFSFTIQDIVRVWKIMTSNEPLNRSLRLLSSVTFLLVPANSPLTTYVRHSSTWAELELPNAWMTQGSGQEKPWRSLSSLGPVTLGEFDLLLAAVRDRSCRQRWRMQRQRNPRIGDQTLLVHWATLMSVTGGTDLDMSV